MARARVARSSGVGGRGGGSHRRVHLHGPESRPGTELGDGGGVHALSRPGPVRDRTGPRPVRPRDGRPRARGYRAADLWVLSENDRARRFYEAAGWRAEDEERTESLFEIELRETRYRIEL